MSFYQVCYTRVGKQERNAGWRVVAATKGVSKEALERFKSIASNAIQQKNLYEVIPSEIFFIQSDDRFVYLCNMVADCPGDDGRSNSFIHGYIIVRKEYYRRCEIPASIFGMVESEFIKEIPELGNSQEKDLPRKDKIQYRNWNRQALIKKYGIEEIFDKLMVCVLSVLERKSASLCIRMRKERLDMLKEQSKEIMFCIMDRLPRILRIQLTASSFGIGKGKLFFSVEIPEKNQEFLDLETGECLCRLDGGTGYTFIEDFFGNFQENEAWEQTEAFLETVYGWNGCSAVSFRLIEIVYSYYSLREPQNALEDLYVFLGAGPSICPVVYCFLEYLLLRIDVEQVDESMLEKLCCLKEMDKNLGFEEIFTEWIRPLSAKSMEVIRKPKKAKSIVNLKMQTKIGKFCSVLEGILKTFKRAVKNKKG